ncbi:MAG: hypothetical protein BGO10_02050 [Chlamydia sp. 32-24]|nr:MAG: hypothetical protein BGO10_02050 [Chlamydia sp. 32-24]
MRVLKIGLICGGPSKERGISLNSARSVLDHLSSPTIEIYPIYIDKELNFYIISKSQLYSNTPSDFDFKLNQTAIHLTQEKLDSYLRSMDLVIPVIHGKYGEDGQLQEKLEKLSVPFLGLSSTCCRTVFHKYTVFLRMQNLKFPRPPCLHLVKDKTDIKSVIDFFEKYALNKAILKPCISGSSIGVKTVCSPAETLKGMNDLFQEFNELILEPFCEGREFTLIVIENEDKQPVALIPTEIETDYSNNQIFDYRKKYLPTNNTLYHTPPTFSINIIENIRKQAETLFTLFKMKDFIRMDGWVLDDGTIYFTDFNPVCGMEQNSFLFRQGSLIGFSHETMLKYLVKNCCEQANISFPEEQLSKIESPQEVAILMGGDNAERQVSLMSGTNVWLKLLHSNSYQPTLYLYVDQNEIWKLPYSCALNHTVEEVRSNCYEFEQHEEKIAELKDEIQCKLKITHPLTAPEKFTLKEFITKAKEDNAFVFIAMHGGDGENGTMQRLFEENDLKFNGSSSLGSKICMDKFLTGQIICDLKDPKITAVPKKIINFIDTKFDNSYWKSLCEELQANEFIIKPQLDGCSAGIIKLFSLQDLQTYSYYIKQKAKSIPPYTFINQIYPIEMPVNVNTSYIIEPYIETDRLFIENNNLVQVSKTGWLELTVGVLEEEGVYTALSPSITIAEGDVLSLEEKFQGGTGVNITPAPKEIFEEEAIAAIKQGIEKVAEALQISNYARIDIFFNRITNNMIVIEANSLPGLTPSTVIYHQALAEEPPLYPKAFLEKLIDMRTQKNLSYEKLLAYSNKK